MHHRSGSRQRGHRSEDFRTTLRMVNPKRHLSAPMVSTHEWELALLGRPPPAAGDDDRRGAAGQLKPRGGKAFPHPRNPLVVLGPFAGNFRAVRSQLAVELTIYVARFEMHLPFSLGEALHRGAQIVLIETDKDRFQFAR